MSCPEAYTIGWICAVGAELVAASVFLDEEYDDLEHTPPNDNNTYTLGRIGKHNVVIAPLPHWQYGLVSAATVARDMVRSFPNIRIGLMVGIGGGAPSSENDIRLGDIVVGSPGYGTGGVLQYDYGKTVQDTKFTMTGYLNQPPQSILTAISVLKSKYEIKGHNLQEEIDRVLARNPRLRAKYQRPDSSTDRLYESSYKHVGGDSIYCTTSCCDTSMLIRRTERTAEEDSLVIHFGVIASANQLMKDATLRDRLSADQDVLCFEMEAAGLMNHFPCLIVRGICDYSDTHKNENWQGYAAMAAAAYAKDLMCKVTPNKVEAERRLADVLSNVDSKLESINSYVQTTITEIRSIQMDQHSDEIMQWLAPPDVSSNFNKAIKARHPGSGQRLLESKAYTTWKTGDSSFLWLHGIPGCGKTILASTVIEDLQASQGQSPSYTLLYFYFDFTDSRKQSFENTLRSLVWQIYHQNEVARKHLDSLYSSVCQGGKKQPSFDSLQRTFTEMMGSLEEVWTVLDALDECTPRGELLAWVRNITQAFSIQVKMHFLVTSRPEQDIKGAIQKHASDEQMIAIRDDLLEADIRNYVQARVREHEGLSRWRGHKEIQDKIEASLREKADGMFRWVSCQLDALEDCLERKALLKALQSLPQTLDETYERILANIPSAYIHHTRRILQFLTYSERPLRLEEAVDAMAVDVRKNIARGCRFDPEDRLPVPEEITRYCSSLVVLVSRQDKYGKKQEVKEIQLAHFSVKDYLTSDRLDSQTARYLQETFARSSIAEVCLAYLLELDHNLTTEEIKKGFYFAQYSARYWANYAVIGEQKSEYVFELAKELFLNHALLEIWCYLYNMDTPWQNERKGDDIAPALYYASFVGLQRCVNMLLDKKADVNAYGGHYGHALQAASYRGHREIVQLLLNRGADVNIQGGRDFSNALEAASYGGHEEVVRLLVGKGANVNAKGSTKFGNALQAASSAGNKKIVQILLGKGADVNIEGGEHNSPLQAAAYNGKTEIYKLLLDNGADVCAKEEHGHTPLHQAAIWGDTKAGRWLLQCTRVNVNAEDNNGRTPLFHASKEGHDKFLELLLSNERVDPCINDRYESSALFAAVRNGHQRTAELLIEHGQISVTQRDCFGRNLASWAVETRSSHALLQLLRRHDPDLDMQASEDHTPADTAPLAIDRRSDFCDICTKNIPQSSPYYVCEICNDGDFYICRACFNFGTPCQNISHKRVRQEQDPIQSWWSS